MDRDRSELQSLGFLGVYGETSKIVLKWRKIFAQIALALILPFCAIYLAHSLVSQLLASKIIDHEITRNDTWYDDPRYGDLSRRLKKEWVAFWLVRLGYFILAFIFSLLSISAVASAVACIYAAAEQVTFKKVIGVVPRVWKRLTVTFMWSLTIFFVYSVVAAGLLIVWLVIVRRSSVGATVGIAVAVVLLILYVVGFVYITMICQLASVISVLEDAHGRKAIAKSRRLMKGKMGVSVGCFLGVLVCAVLVQALFECFVVWDLVPGIGIKIGVGLICLLLLLMVVLFDLVVQTVIYFVCKSHHHENIDSSSLSEGQKPVQLEQLHV